MKVNILAYTKLILILSLFAISLSINDKNKKKAHTIADSSFNIEGYTRECTEFKSCLQCTFDEMKNEEICEETGAYLVKYCKYYDDDNQIKGENHIKEACENAYTVKSTIKAMVFFIILGLLSLYLRKKQKDKIIGNVFQRLTQGKGKVK